MADETLTELYTGATWPNGYSTSNLMLLVDVTDNAMASTGTDKGITVGNWLSQYVHAGTNITITPGSTGVTIASSGGVPPVSSVFTRTGAVTAQTGDYTVAQVTGAAPLASPTFTGTVTLPAGTVTLAQQANLVASSLMGNPTGSAAAPSPITLGANLSFSGTTLVASGGGGGGLTIGGAVTGGTAGRVLYESTGPVLADNANLKFDGTNLAIGSAGQAQFGVDGYINQPTIRQLVFGTTDTAGILDLGFFQNNVGIVYVRLEGRTSTSLTGNVPEFQFMSNTGAPCFAIGNVSSVATTKAATVMPFMVRGYISQSAPLMGLQQLSSTSTARNCGIIDATFNVSTDASWTGNLSLYAGDFTSSNSGQRLGMKIQSNGSVALIGFYGATPVIQPATTGTTTGFTANTGTAVQDASTFTGNIGSTAYRINDIVRALKQLGLLTQ